MQKQDYEVVTSIVMGGDTQVPAGRYRAKLAEIRKYPVSPNSLYQSRDKYYYLFLFQILTGEYKGETVGRTVTEHPSPNSIGAQILRGMGVDYEPQQAVDLRGCYKRAYEIMVEDFKEKTRVCWVKPYKPSPMPTMPVAQLEDDEPPFIDDEPPFEPPF